MLNDNGFDLWADGYDESVGPLRRGGNLSPLRGTGRSSGRSTGACSPPRAEGPGHRLWHCTLTAKLCAQGCQIFGQDFSPRMIELAREKMPGAVLCQGDFSKGLAGELKRRKYDAIVATYSLHHLTDAQKVAFLRELLPLLEEGGRIYIGDVAFATRADLAACGRGPGTSGTRTRSTSSARTCSRTSPP